MTPSWASGERHQALHLPDLPEWGTLRGAAHITGMTNSFGPSRTAAGTPAGGQFAAQAHPDSGISVATGAPALTADEATRHADRLIYSALAMYATSSACRDDTSPGQAAYYAGMARADARAAAGFLTEGPDEEATATALIIDATRAGYDSADTEGLAAAVSGSATGHSPSTISRSRAEDQLTEHLDALCEHHAAAHPTVAPADKNAGEWESLGLRNGTAEAAARWADLKDPENAGDRSRALVAAVNDGITNPTTLRDVARGRLLRGDDGEGWYDPAEDFYV